MARIGLLVAALALSSFAGQAAPPTTSGSASRPFRVDDVLHRVRWSQPTFSPSGDMMAMVVRRGAEGEARSPRPDMEGYDLADIWLIPTGAGAPRRLAADVRDVAGMMRPAWSPDGKRIAYLAYRSGDFLQPAVSLRDGGEHRLLYDQAVDTAAKGGLQWIDARRLLAVLLPDGEQPAMVSRNVQTQRLATQGWARQAGGQAPSVSILDGGIPITERRSGALAILGLDGTAEPLAEGRFSRVELSPNRSHALVLRLTRWAGPTPRILDGFRPMGRIGIVDLRTGKRNDKRTLWPAGLPEVAIDGPLEIAWSPGMDRVAVLTRAPGSSSSAIHLVDVATGGTSVAGTSLSGPELIHWTRSGELLAYSRRPGEEGHGWWIVAPSQAIAPAPLSLPLARKLIDLPCGRIGVVSGGELWTSGSSGGVPSNLTAGFIPDVKSVSQVPGSVALDESGQLLLETSAGLARLEFKDCDAVISPIKLPSDRATPFAFDRSTGTTVAQAHTSSGSLLWSLTDKDWQLRMQANRHFAEAKLADRRLVRYTGGDGDPLSAQIVLPSDYKRGVRYPAIVWVYPTLSPDNLSDLGAFRPGSFYWWQPEVLAARGYVVIIPTFSHRDDEKKDLFEEVMKDVPPAIDAAIAEGYIDPQRLGVFGESFGGWTVYSLLSQTTRFKAAAATLGFTDPAGWYGIFDSRDRYTDNPALWNYADYVEQPAFFGFDRAPWEDRWWWTKNSPRIYLDRIDTPLLIAQGDLDMIPIQQNEELFTVLSRRGKRVRFLRYWGEAHEFASPANIKHLWNEVGTWFDSHLKN